MNKKLLLSFCITAFVWVNTGFSMPKKTEDMGIKSELTTISQKEKSTGSVDHDELLFEFINSDRGFLKGDLKSDEEYTLVKRTFWQRNKRRILTSMMMGAGIIAAGVAGVGLAYYFLLPDAATSNLFENGTPNVTELIDPFLRIKETMNRTDTMPSNLFENQETMNLTNTATSNSFDDHVSHMQSFHDILDQRTLTTSTPSPDTTLSILLEDQSLVTNGIIRRREAADDYPFFEDHSREILPEGYQPPEIEISAVVSGKSTTNQSLSRYYKFLNRIR
ncbi:MAG: hypothetical protein ACRC12_00895 [Holosporales bacterium]